jgi:flavodoxin I
MIMSKVAVVYWSGTGNTEQMAESVADGARNAGADVTTFTAAEFDADKMDEFDAIAFGCPSMGAEQLEEDEFEPMFTACEAKLSGKKIALFGSYGWGDGEWMREWESRMLDAGANVLNREGLICHETPDDDALEDCRSLGKQLASL